MEFDEIDEITTETQKGLLQPQPKGREDIGIVDSFMQGTAIPNQLRANALNRDLLQAQKQKYDEAMEFLPMNKAIQGVSPYMREPMLQALRSSGYIKTINGVEGLHRYQQRQFQQEFSKNEIMQSSVISASNLKVQEGLKAMSQQLQQDPKLVAAQKEWMQYSTNIKNWEKEQRLDIKNPNKFASKINAEQLKLDTFMRGEAWGGVEKVKRQMAELYQEHLREINALGLKDARYEKLTNEYGQDDAMHVMLGRMTEYEARVRKAETLWRGRENVSAEGASTSTKAYYDNTVNQDKPFAPDRITVKGVYTAKSSDGKNRTVTLMTNGDLIENGKKTTLAPNEKLFKVDKEDEADDTPFGPTAPDNRDDALAKSADAVTALLAEQQKKKAKK